jgi:hypothetical protein
MGRLCVGVGRVRYPTEADHLVRDRVRAAVPVGDRDRVDRLARVGAVGKLIEEAVALDEGVAVVWRIGAPSFGKAAEGQIPLLTR